MTNKDEASPRQRQIMEARWAKARRDCPEGTCVPASRFHVAGCVRRTQKVKATNLNTGITDEAEILPEKPGEVKKILEQHDKQAVLLEPLRAELEFPEKPMVHAPAQVLSAPVRPWWKFWGRRG